MCVTKDRETFSLWTLLIMTAYLNVPLKKELKELACLPKVVFSSTSLVPEG